MFRCGLVHKWPCNGLHTCLFQWKILAKELFHRHGNRAVRQSSWFHPCFAIPPYGFGSSGVWVRVTRAIDRVAFSLTSAFSQAHRKRKTLFSRRAVFDSGEDSEEGNSGKTNREGWPNSINMNQPKTPPDEEFSRNLSELFAICLSSFSWQDTAAPGTKFSKTIHKLLQGVKMLFVRRGLCRTTVFLGEDGLLGLDAPHTHTLEIRRTTWMAACHSLT